MRMVTDQQRTERHLVGVGVHAGYGEQWGLFWDNDGGFRDT